MGNQDTGMLYHSNYASDPAHYFLLKLAEFYHFFSTLAINNITPAKLPMYILILPKNKIILGEKDIGIPL
ncbi:hypothetical protein [Enterobacter ludwigii]